MRQHGTTLGIATVSSLRARHDAANAWHSADVKGPSKATQARAKSLPPPPPLAAYVQRTDRPAPSVQTATQTASLGSTPAPLPKPMQTPMADWLDNASDHFGASLRGPKPEPRAWGKIIGALGIGAVAVLGAGLAAGLVSRTFHDGPVLYSERPTTALASAQHSAWVARPKTAHVVVQSAVTVAPTTAAAPEVAPEAHNVLLPAALVLPPLAALPIAPSPAVAETTLAVTSHAAHHATLATKAKRATSATEPNAAVMAANDARPVAAVTANEDLPAQPTREQIKEALSAVRPALEACSANSHGTMFANLNITGSGRVSYSNIEGAFAGSTEGSCMARALRTAEFPRFASASLKVRYPFVL
jgi:hypothetical protein